VGCDLKKSDDFKKMRCFELVAEDDAVIVFRALMMIR